MKHLISTLIFLVVLQDCIAMGNDDPLLFGLQTDKLEIRDNQGTNDLAWDVSLWAGFDFHKLQLASEGKRSDGQVDKHEASLSYAHAVSPYWDVAIGWREDLEPEPSRYWLKVGMQGTAPYFIETSVDVFIGEEGRSGLRIESEKEFLLTQRWHLVPEVEINFHGHNDVLTKTGSGLSEFEFGLRLAYVVQREVSPYLGIYWERKFGNTADFHEAIGEEIKDAQLIAGFKIWF